MIGRLFNLVLLVALAFLLLRALLSSQQRQALHGLFKTIAFALVLSSMLLVALVLAGIISR